MPEDFRLILDIVLVLAAAATGGFLASLFRQPPLLGYLLAGILVGPTGLGLIKEVMQVETLAQFGVTLLLFCLGVEFSLAQMRRVQGIALGGGILQILITIGFVTLLTIGSGMVDYPVQGIVLGAILALSSTAVVLKSLAEANATDSAQGQAMLGILIVQDLAVGLMLAMLPALNHAPEAMGLALGRAVLEIGLFGVGALAAGIWVVPVFLKILAQRESKEVFLLGVISLCVGIAVLTEKLGISSEIGAFVAGLMVSEVDYADQTLDYVEPLRDVFAALFFAAIGMLVDPYFIWAHLSLIAGLVTLAVVGKVLIITPLVRLFRYPMRTAVLVGVGLAQIGEFSFVLASEGQKAGLLSHQLYLLVVSTTAMTLLVTPLLFRAAPTLLDLLEKVPVLGSWLAEDDSPREVSPDLPHQDHVVICGYGQVGQDIARLMQARRQPLLVIDQSERAIQQLRERGIPYLYGNAASELVLQRANIPQARAMVIGIPDRYSLRLCLKRSLALAPELDIVVQAPDKEDIEMLYQQGAAEVVQPNFEASLELCSHILLTLGEDVPAIQQEVMAIRNRHYADLRPQRPSCLIRPLAEPSLLDILAEQANPEDLHLDPFSLEQSLPEPENAT
ncbi:MAG: sodium:calcium exchanger [Synechococcaceae cyanobacterium SM2_3_2]|nr:sodium:calcium exchanger [Synechococcaceae cyanobacterium SM2_3_2]